MHWPFRAKAIFNRNFSVRYTARMHVAGLENTQKKLLISLVVVAVVVVLLV